MKYTTILFDLDGTLLDTLDDLMDSVNYIMTKYNYPTHSKEAIRSFVGNGLKKLLERALPNGLETENFDMIFEEFVQYYNCHNLIKTAPYAGVRETTNTLSEMGIKMAIVTNKGQTASESLLKDFFYPQIKVVVGDGNGRKVKPAPDNVNEALKQLGVTDKKTVLYIGDSEVDAQTAINSDLDYILCKYGFRDMDVIGQFNPIAFIDSFSELVNYIS